MRKHMQPVLVASLAFLLAGGCGRQINGQAAEAREAEIEAAVQARIERALEAALDRITAYADSVDDVFQPLPLLTPGEEAALRQYAGRQHLAQARRLGVSPPLDAAALERLQREGRLVRLEASTAYWAIRELEHSVPLVTPDVEALLTEIGARFQARLGRLGLPPLRLEVTSALRTAESQLALRNVNPNAARGVSAHEYGTTVDVAYSSFRAPAQPAPVAEAPAAPWLAPYLHRFAEALTEAVAARRSRELQAILGQVLQELQAEGKVLVLLERQQPVFHLTVAQPF